MTATDEAVQTSLKWERSILRHAKEMIEEVYESTSMGFGVEDPCDSAQFQLGKAINKLDEEIIVEQEPEHGFTD